MAKKKGKGKEEKISMSPEGPVTLPLTRESKTAFDVLRAGGDPVLMFVPSDWLKSGPKATDRSAIRISFETAPSDAGPFIVVGSEQASVRAVFIDGPPEELKILRQQIEEQNLWTTNLDRERGVLRLTPVGDSGEYLQTAGPGHYAALQQALSRGDFHSVPGSPWPTAQLEKGDAHGRAELRPVEPHEELILAPEELEALAVRMWRQREELSPIDADVLDAVSSEWIKRAKRPDQKVAVRIDGILRLRGLKPKKGGSGTRGGYRPEQRGEILAALRHLESVWLEITEATVYEETGPRRKRKPRRLTLQSRAFVMTDRLGQKRLDGSLDVESVLVTPGEAFGRFLFSPGRQVALLSAEALKFDPYRQAPEKALLRYLSWQWRAGKEGAYLRAFRAETLLREAGIPYEDGARPNRVRNRLEKALDRLLDAGAIAAWQYETGWREDRLPPRRWLREWLLARIEVEAPDVIKAAYADIEPLRGHLMERPPKAETLGRELRQVRHARGLSQLRAAEEIGISQGYVAQIEGGRTPGPQVRRKVEKWLHQ